MERFCRNLLVLTALSVLIGVGAWINFRYTGIPYFASEETSQIITSKTKNPPTYALHVLFIGNSFTFVQHIPQQLADIASSDPDNPIQFVIQSVTRGSCDLKDMWDDGKALEALHANHWDYVVLQDQSGWAMMEVYVHKTYQYATAFDSEIRKSGAKTLLYLTWVEKPGSHWYTDADYSYLVNPNYMYKRLISNTYDLAGKLGAAVVPVGAYWQTTLAQEPEIDLYSSDEHHPGPAGAYLSALTFYKTLTNRDVTKVTYQPNGVSEKTAEKIRAIVAAPLSGQTQAKQ